jgi:hypothetical protein
MRFQEFKEARDLYLKENVKTEGLESVYEFLDGRYDRDEAVNESFLKTIGAWLKKNFSPKAIKIRSLGQDYHNWLSKEFDAEYRESDDKEMDRFLSRERVSSDIEDEIESVAGDDETYRKLAKQVILTNRIKAKKEFVSKKIGKDSDIYEKYETQERSSMRKEDDLLDEMSKEALKKAKPVYDDLRDHIKNDRVNEDVAARLAYGIIKFIQQRLPADKELKIEDCKEEYDLTEKLYFNKHKEMNSKEGARIIFLIRTSDSTEITAISPPLKVKKLSDIIEKIGTGIFEVVKTMSFGEKLTKSAEFEGENLMKNCKGFMIQSAANLYADSKRIDYAKSKEAIKKMIEKEGCKDLKDLRKASDDLAKKWDNTFFNNKDLEKLANAIEEEVKETSANVSATTSTEDDNKEENTKTDIDEKTLKELKVEEILHLCIVTYANFFRTSENKKGNILGATAINVFFKKSISSIFEKEDNSDKEIIKGILSYELKNHPEEYIENAKSYLAKNIFNFNNESFSGEYKTNLVDEKIKHIKEDFEKLKDSKYLTQKNILKYIVYSKLSHKALEEKSLENLKKILEKTKILNCQP